MEEKTGWKIERYQQKDETQDEKETLLPGAGTVSAPNIR